MGFECVGVALPALLMPTKVTSTRGDLCGAHRFIVQRDACGSKKKLTNTKLSQTKLIKQS